MRATVSKPEGTASYLEGSSTGPKRILVQTNTRLVPGDDYHRRLLFMLDLTCQHHWNRDYLPDQVRWSVYGCRFGYDNRRCYVLVHHGQSSNDDGVPVLWYQWTAESLYEHPFVPGSIVV